MECYKATYLEFPSAIWALDLVGRYHLPHISLEDLICRKNHIVLTQHITRQVRGSVGTMIDTDRKTIMFRKLLDLGLPLRQSNDWANYERSGSSSTANLLSSRFGNDGLGHIFHNHLVLPVFQTLLPEFFFGLKSPKIGALGVFGPCTSVLEFRAVIEDGSDRLKRFPHAHC